MIPGLRLAVCLAGLLPAASHAQAEYQAFSLREAACCWRSGRHTEELQTLGGLCRILGFVLDDHRDLILLGRRIPHQPMACLADLATAMRTRLIHQKWPYLSLDPDERTRSTGLLRVTTDGGIAGGPWHAALLAADVGLKRASMDRVSGIPDLSSYSHLLVERRRTELAKSGTPVRGWRWLDAKEFADAIRTFQGRPVAGQERVHVRFWYEVDQAWCRFVDGAFCICRLSLCVRVQHLHPDPRQLGPEDPSAREFAGLYSARIPNILSRDASLQKVKLLYDLVQIAEGVRGLSPRPDLDWLLRDVPIPPSADAREFHPAGDLCALLDLQSGEQEAIQVTGGVELRAHIQDLNDGSLEPLRSLVLAARPSADALSWPVPLEGWAMPNAEGLALPTDLPPAEDRPGTSVFAQRFAFRALHSSADPALPVFGGFEVMPLPRPGGVSMAMGVQGTSLIPDRSGLLDRLERQIRGNPPAPGQLTWPTTGTDSRPHPGERR